MLDERNCVVCGRWFRPKTKRNSICALSGDKCRKLRKQLICALWYADSANRVTHIHNVVKRKKAAKEK